MTSSSLLILNLLEFLYPLKSWELLIGCAFEEMFFLLLPRQKRFIGFLLYEKSVGVCTCYPSHAKRPSHCPSLLNEQRRSPRRYVYQTFGIPYETRYTSGAVLHTHGHLLLPHSWQWLKVAKFLSVKNKASSKRLNHIMIPTIKTLHMSVSSHPFADFCII